MAPATASVPATGMNPTGHRYPAGVDHDTNSSTSTATNDAAGAVDPAAATATETALFAFDDWFARELPELTRPWEPQPVANPELLVVNDALAHDLGADPAALTSPYGVALLAGNVVPRGAHPVAQGYAGHQFGGFSPRLGDGRAVLLGEVIDPAGHRHDLHLKGSGRTSFARGGDGRAAVGPMLREYLMGEAMHALGISTTRMLAVVATGELVQRDDSLPGAVVTRVASSHLRIGTFQYAAMADDPSVLQRLADHAIARHHPAAAGAEQPYLGLLDAVIDAQAELVASWMLVGFIHGVLNTDNVTISGQTIDYGPCAFMDTFDPATVFSSIDTAGRYAYGNQPSITQWNLARLAETLLVLLDDDTDAAVEMATASLHTFTDRYDYHWRSGLRRKLGISHDDATISELDDSEVLDDLMVVLRSGNVDMTRFFRALADAVDGDDTAVRSLVDDPPQLDGWLARWRTQLPLTRRSPQAIAADMNAVNPVYVPRNHLVEHALDTATAGDLGPFEELLAVLTDPFNRRRGLEAYELGAPDDFGPHRTFCGT